MPLREFTKIFPTISQEPVTWIFSNCSQEGAALACTSSTLPGMTDIFKPGLGAVLGSKYIIVYSMFGQKYV